MENKVPPYKYQKYEITNVPKTIEEICFPKNNEYKLLPQQSFLADYLHENKNNLESLGLLVYHEIESKTETELFDLMKKLNLTAEKFTSLDLYYEYYGITKDRKQGDLLFSNVVEIMTPYITKNKDSFIKLVQHQKSFLDKYYKK
jgi:hypothetical protein